MKDPSLSSQEQREPSLPRCYVSSLSLSGEGDSRDFSITLNCNYSLTVLVRHVFLTSIYIIIIYNVLLVSVSQSACGNHLNVLQESRVTNLRVTTITSHGFTKSWRYKSMLAPLQVPPEVRLQEYGRVKDIRGLNNLSAHCRLPIKLCHETDYLAVLARSPVTLWMNQQPPVCRQNPRIPQSSGRDMLSTLLHRCQFSTWDERTGPSTLVVLVTTHYIQEQSQS